MRPPTRSRWIRIQGLLPSRRLTQARCRGRRHGRARPRRRLHIGRRRPPRRSSFLSVSLSAIYRVSRRLSAMLGRASEAERWLKQKLQQIRERRNAPLPSMPEPPAIRKPPRYVLKDETPPGRWRVRPAFRSTNGTLLAPTLLRVLRRPVWPP